MYLDKEENARFLEWKNEHDRSCRFSDPMACGVSGGRFTFSFTPTSLGVVVVVKCACGEKVDVTDYSW